MELSDDSIGSNFLKLDLLNSNAVFIYIYILYQYHREKGEDPDNFDFTETSDPTWSCRWN